MNEKTYKVLEYDKIIEMLKDQASSQMTRRIISEMVPSSDPAEIREMLKETTEAAQIIVRKGPVPLGAFYDIEDSLHLSRKGGTLSMRQAS